MKNIAFLHKLVRQKKLQIVEPSEELKTAYVQRSAESLSSAKTLLSVGNLKDAVALAYYAMYHILLALLFRVGIKCENHTASIFLLYDIFNIDNSHITKATDERVDKQYYIDFTITKDEVTQTIIIAEEFRIQIIDFIARLQEEQIQTYHQKARKLVEQKGN